MTSARNTCSSCGAALLWAKTGSGRAMPLDAEPCPTGNVELVGGVAKSWGSSHEWPPGAVRYTSHFAICTHPAEHRRPR